MRYRKLITSDGQEILIGDNPSVGFAISIDIDDTNIVEEVGMESMTIADLESIVSSARQENDTISISMNQQTPAVEKREI